MANPKFIEQTPVSLADAKTTLKKAKKRDEELNYVSNKVQEYLDCFTTLSQTKKDELHKKLKELDLTRLKEEHMIKIIDFLPKDVDELKVVLQAYPLSLPKKDMDVIIKAVAEFL